MELVPVRFVILLDRVARVFQLLFSGRYFRDQKGCQRSLLVVLVVGAMVLPGRLAVAQGMRGLSQQYCLECHTGETPAANIDLSSLLAAVTEENVENWKKVVFALERQEMPPPDAEQPSRGQRREMLGQAERQVIAYLKRHQAPSRTVLRRLNQAEYRNTIRDLFHLDVSQWDPAEHFPEDETVDGFNNNGQALVTSDFLLRQYLVAGSEAVRRATHWEDRPRTRHLKFSPPPPTGAGGRVVQRFEAVGGKYRPLMSRPWKKGGFHMLESLDKEGLPVSGYYRFRIVVSAHQHPRAFSEIEIDPQEVPVLAIMPTLSGYGNVSRPTTREFVAARVNVPYGNGNVEFEKTIWLNAGVVPRLTWLNGPVKPLSDKLVEKYARDRFRPRKKNWADGEKTRYLNEMWRVLAEVYRGPEMRLHELEIEGPLLKEWPPRSHQTLYGQQSLQEQDPVEVVSRFARRAFRGQATDDNIRPYQQLVRRSVASGQSPQQAVENGLRAVLCAPEFIYRKEKAGKLTGIELANRLSYFLWSSMPDRELLVAAENGMLQKGNSLREQVERMLSDPKSAGFVANFLDRWLELYRLGTMPPDENVYPQYFRGDLELAMRQETELFFRHLLDKNLDVENLIDGKFTFVNYHLAQLYGIKGVEGSDFQKVALTDRRRGGLLGQASILTATANGIDTSPVVRGVWVLNNLLGTPPSPPPANVPEIEPDIRGAATVREQLARHRNVKSCASCHRRIDPAGFALESFGPIGEVREVYPGKQKIETGGVTPSGDSFKDIVTYKTLLLKRKPEVARCVVEKLLTYATGRKMEFSDRPQVSQILLKWQQQGYGLRDLLHLVVASDLFRSK